MYHAALRVNHCFVSTYFNSYISSGRGEGGGPPPLFGRNQNGVVSFNLLCGLLLVKVDRLVTLGCPVDRGFSLIDSRGPLVYVGNGNHISLFVTGCYGLGYGIR